MLSPLIGPCSNISLLSYNLQSINGYPNNPLTSTEPLLSKLRPLGDYLIGICHLEVPDTSSLEMADQVLTLEQEGTYTRPACAHTGLGLCRSKRENTKTPRSILSGSKNNNSYQLPSLMKLLTYQCPHLKGVTAMS